MSDCELFAQIAQDKWATVSKSLRSLKTNERPWTNRSDRSWQKSDCERFAQVAHDKWGNEQIPHFFSESLVRSFVPPKKKSLKKIWLISFFFVLFVRFSKKWMIRSFLLFYWAMRANRSGRSPIMSDHEQFAQVAHKNERPWANCSGCLQKICEWANR